LHQLLELREQHNDRKTIVSRKSMTYRPTTNNASDYSQRGGSVLTTDGGRHELGEMRRRHQHQTTERRVLTQRLVCRLGVDGVRRFGMMLCDEQLWLDVIGGRVVRCVARQRDVERRARSNLFLLLLPVMLLITKNNI
jgi:hypothetical protein